jgi:hypothetical protein
MSKRNLLGIILMLIVAVIFLPTPEDSKRPTSQNEAQQWAQYQANRAAASGGGVVGARQNASIGLQTAAVLATVGWNDAILALIVIGVVLIFAKIAGASFSLGDSNGKIIIVGILALIAMAVLGIK